MLASSAPHLPKGATRLYPTVAREVARLRAESVLLDGEVVAVDEEGFPNSKPSINSGVRSATSQAARPAIGARAFLSLTGVCDLGTTPRRDAWTSAEADHREVRLRREGTRGCSACWHGRVRCLVVGVTKAESFDMIEARNSPEIRSCDSVQRCSSA